MTVQVVLGVILFLLMVLFGGKKGAKSFFTLFLNFLMLFILIMFMIAPNANHILLTIIACIAITAINLFYINGFNVKTKTAFLASVITLLLLLVVILFITTKAKIQGFGEEEVEEISAFSIYIGVDFVKIGAAVIIMSAIGSIVDIAISISSPMYELFRHQPKTTRKELTQFGLHIGRDVLGTDTNTLFFAFFGGYLSLLIWFKDLSYSFSEIINGKIFSAELITILLAGTGVALIIPVTAWVTAIFLVRMDKKTEKKLK